MKTEDFTKYLGERIKSLQEEWDVNEGKALGMWLAKEYFQLEDLDAFECVSADGGNDKDIFLGV